MTGSRPLRIGYLIDDYPPALGAGPARAAEMAARWLAAGAEVTVIAGMPNRPRGIVHPEYRGRAFVDERRDGVRVLRSWVFASPRRGVLRTVANNVSVMTTSALHSLFRAGPLDVLIASSPPFFEHLAGDALRRLTGVPLVLEIRDLWPDYMVQMGMLKARPARALFALERALLRRATETVVVTESFRRRVVEKGVDPARVTVVPNGIDAEQYRPSDEPPPFPEMERREGSLVVGYLGNFGAGQALQQVVDAAAALLPTHPHLRFVMAGDGPERQRVLEHAAAVGASNLSIHPPIPKDRTRAFYNACDICLVPLAPIPIFQETVPSKIFEVMACGRPVLAALEGEGARIVEDSGGGVLATPGDPASIAASVARLAEIGPAARDEMGRRGRAHVLEHYLRDTLAARYLGVLERAAATRPRR